MRSNGRVIGLAFTLACLLSLPTLVGAEEASSYRGFRLGMTVLEVTTVAGVPPTAVKVVFEQPALIQELAWRPGAAAGATGSAPTRDSVAQVFFDFYNGTLFRVVVNYDRERTEGLTAQDLVEALSVAYGPALRPTEKVIISRTNDTFSESAPVTARWEDASASISLFRGNYGPYGLVIVSKAAEPQARAAIAQSLRQAELDAPRRVIAEQKAWDDRLEAASAKARMINKPTFKF